MAKAKSKAKSKTKSKVKPKSVKSKKPAAKLAAKPAAKKAKPVISKPTPKAKPANWQNFFSPLDNRVVIEVQPVEERTPGGLYIPQMAQPDHSRGRVVAVGPGRRDKKGKLHPLAVSVGDQVLLPQYAGAKVTVLDREVLIVREDEILGVVG